MISVEETRVFSKWLSRLRDRKALVKILLRIDRLRLGHFGDVRSVGEGVNELRIDFGPGYRVYFVRRDQALLLLLCGGDKGTQARDIDEAKRIARALKDDP